MKGDFSRVSFDPVRHYSRVLLQQGRVALDADPNEQADILMHYLRSLARDLIGPHAGPEGHFLLSTAEDGSLLIGPGHYYVDGILCENELACSYAAQPDFQPADEDPLLQALNEPGADAYRLYLDVWERHVTAIEDASVREVALNGPDTCTRTQVVWQVRALKVEGQEPNADGNFDCAAPLQGLLQGSDARLAARVDPGQQSESPCSISPEARYRGAENHLYRVEIHHVDPASGAATFKWSRDNGSVAARWLGREGDDLIVAASRGFTPGCWLELGDDALDLGNQPGALVRLLKVEGDRLTIDPGTAPAGALEWSPQRRNPKLRRWDQTDRGDVTLADGAVPVSEASAQDPAWIDLEDGVQVQFAAGGSYRSGDYWLIPARVATGNIEWPGESDALGRVVPASLPPRGVQHHYAPLGYLSWVDGEAKVQNCQCRLQPINSCGAAVPLPQPPVRPPQPLPQPPVVDTRPPVRPVTPVAPVRPAGGGVVVEPARPTGDQPRPVRPGGRRRPPPG